MTPEIIKLAKSMKKEFVEISESYITGTDVNRKTLSIIYEGYPEYYIGTMAEMEGKKKPDYWRPEEIIRRELFDIKSRTFNITSNNPILFQVDNLKEDESFEELLAKKASDGASIYRLNPQFLMYTFSSLHPINKPDKISCEIYPYDMMSYLSHFTIFKKKHSIHEYIRYLYL